MAHGGAVTSAGFAAELWARYRGVNPLDLTNSLHIGVAGWYSGSSNRGWGFYVGRTGRWMLAIGYGDATRTIQGAAVVPGEWVHLAVAHNGSLALFHLNGTLQAPD